MLRRFSLVLSALLLGLPVSAGCSDEPACSDGTVSCSSDGTELVSCENGKRKVTACMRDRGQLCEASGSAIGTASCVDPWRYGSPTFDSCATEPLATTESLRDKARAYQDTAWRLHVHPDLGWIMDVRLKPGASAATATFRDVERWESGPNDGLWNALYIAAEAYRYGATREPEALDRLRVLMASQEKRMRITGVPGIYTRIMRPPNFPGLACPDNLDDYVPDGPKVNDRWVRIDGEGCVETVDGATKTWKKSSHCGLSEFTGWCFLDNVSQDEYAGHMFALAAVSKLVDDPGIQASVKQMLAKVGHHLKDNHLQLVDWDGRVTEHGRIWAHSLLSGFAAAMGASFVKVAADGSGDPALVDFYERCLMREEANCLPHAGATTKTYAQQLQKAALDVGCLTNWNGLSMHILSLHDLAWFERDPERRRLVQRALRDDMWSVPNSERPIAQQNNTWFDFIYAASKALGPGTDGPALDAVKNGVCMLRQFPAQKTALDRSCGDKCPEVCKDRLGHPMTSYARPVAERCMNNFIWWRSPYSNEVCTKDESVVFKPTDYLLTYWMGRYYGFIQESW